MSEPYRQSQAFRTNRHHHTPHHDRSPEGCYRSREPGAKAMKFGIRHGNTARYAEAAGSNPHGL
jgi:hypothetical protein